MAKTQRISPCLWFDNRAEEAANFYTGIFKNSRITQTLRFLAAPVRRLTGSPLDLS